MSADIQRFQSILSHLLTTSQKFTDSDFYPDPAASIGGNYTKYTFRRASEVLDQVAVFQDGIQPTDIKQGILKDSYFLSALSALAEQPALIERLFLTEEANNAGLYAVWICDNGTWKPILLDDYIPCRPYHGNYFPVFSQCKRGELWVALLEKAYAKLHGCYYNIENGLCHYALRDLTGAPVEELYDEPDVDKVWNFIQEGLSRQHFLTCGTELGDEEEDEGPEGIVRGHAYTILDAVEIRGDKEVTRLVKIRNPWGNFEWKGDWSDQSPLWTEELRRELNYDPNPEDGIFFMNIRDYNKYFPVTWLCRYKKDNYYYSVNFQHTVNNYNVIRLIVPERAEVTISLNQRDKRFFKGTNHPDYLYSYARLLLARADKDGLEYVGGNASGFERNLQVTAVLNPGTYLITSEVNWNQEYHKVYNLSFYSECELQIEGVEYADLLGIQKNIIKSAINKIENNKAFANYGKYGDAGIQKTVDCIHGIFYFYYENNSKKKSKLSETIKFSQISNLKICPPFHNDNQFDVTVLPGSELLVLYKATLDDYSWGYSASFFIQTANKEDEKTPANTYIYIDSPNNRVPLDINQDYNLFIRSNVNLEHKLRDPRKEEFGKSIAVGQYEEEKDGYDDDGVYYEETQDYGKDTNYYYSKDFRYEGVRSRGAQSGQQRPKKPSKPAKIYPDINTQIGQTNSKKIKYNNFDNVDKELTVVSSDPKIIYVKTPQLNVRANESADIRLRLLAPNKPGTYQVKLEVRLAKTNQIEEVLQFTINNH